VLSLKFRNRPEERHTNGLGDRAQVGVLFLGVDSRSSTAEIWVRRARRGRFGFSDRSISL